MSITQYTDNNLYVTSNNTRATLSAGINTSQTTIGVSSTALFESTGGFALIYSTNAVTPGTELISYTGISGSDIIGVVRGLESGLGAKNADSGDSIIAGAVAQHHNALKDAIIALAGETEDLRTGVQLFTTVNATKTSDNSAGTTDGYEIFIEAELGGTQFKYNKGAGPYSLAFGKDASSFTPVLELEGDGDWVGAATDQFRVYSKGNMETGAQLGFTAHPAVADGASAIAYKFNAINDLLNAGAKILDIQNNTTSVFSVKKTHIECAQAVISGVTPLNIQRPIADPSSPANGDLWVTDDGSFLTLNIRNGGVTYSVTLT